jgi:fructose-bisphosphate aldolase class 1
MTKPLCKHGSEISQITREHLDLTTTIRSAGSRPKPLESHGIEVEAEKGEEMRRRLTRSSESCSVISASFVF